MLFCLSAIAYAGNDVPLTYHPNGSIIGGNPKTPAAPWYITQDGNVLTMSATPCDYTLTLYDENDVLAYSVFVPAGMTKLFCPLRSLVTLKSASRPLPIIITGTSRCKTLSLVCANFSTEKFAHSP